MNRDEDLAYLKRAMVDLTDEVCKIAPNLSTDIVRTHLSIYDHQEQTIKELSVFINAVCCEGDIPKNFDGIMEQVRHTIKKVELD